MQRRLWPKHLLSASLSSGHPKYVAQVHAHLILTGISTHKNSIAGLICAYAKKGEILSARLLFDKTPERDISVWNAMIMAYSREGSPIKVLDLYHHLITEAIRPDSSTFTVSLKACASLLDLKMGEEIHTRAVDFGYKDDVFVASSVLNLYTKCGKMELAVRVFNEMKRKDLVSWTTIVSGFARSGQATEAIDVYRRMREEGLEGDRIVMVGLIQASAKLGDLKTGISVHGYMIRREIWMDVVVETSLVDMYAKSGCLNLASRVFKKIKYRNVVSWCTMISGFAQNGFAEDALILLIMMQDCGFKPDLVAIVSALLACSHIGCLKLGRSVHGFITRRLLFDPILSTAVIDMYSKCGRISSARTVFDQIGLRDSISWNAMIASYGVHGHSNEALSLFIQMIQAKLKPDDATFASLLSAFSHTGLVEEGRHWFNLMVKEFKIRPSEKHYVCMVDLLARAGQLNEASEVIKSMDFEPGISVWVALLSGCHNYGNLELGMIVAEKVLDMQPDDPGIYALVSNTFALGKKWDAVARAKKLMKSTGVKKVPGYSVVEIKGKLQAFLMEDKSHPQYNMIKDMLQKLEFEMGQRGFIPKTKFVLQDLDE